MANSHDEIGEEGVRPDPPEDAGQEPSESPWPPPGERTPEQQVEADTWEKGVAWLREKWTRSDGHPTPCPYCGHRSWTVGLPTQFVSVSQPGLWSIWPVVPITCANCAHVVLINAQLAGIPLPYDGSPPEPPESR
jgi:hypothetical protein